MNVSKFSVRFVVILGIREYEKKGTFLLSLGRKERRVKGVLFPFRTALVLFVETLMRVVPFPQATALRA